MRHPSEHPLIKVAAGVLALLLSAFLILSMPLISALMRGEGGTKKAVRIVAKAELKAWQPPKAAERPKRELRRPARNKPMQTNIKAGPRFAMDLGAMGGGGAAVAPELVNKTRGSGGSSRASDGEVDSRPEPQSPPPFRAPAEIRSAEIDASVTLSFCVDVSGRPYDIQVVEERPPGKGMGQSGREAVRQTAFRPAMRDGVPVAFCGLEQVLEVKFND